MKCLAFSHQSSTEVSSEHTEGYRGYMKLELFKTNRQELLDSVAACPLTCSLVPVCPAGVEAPSSLHYSSSLPPPTDGQTPFSYDGYPWLQSAKKDNNTLQPVVKIGEPQVAN